MFVLPFLGVPFVVTLALYRLWCIPSRLRHGQLRFNRRWCWMWPTLTLLAYAVLLVHTVALLGAVVCGVFLANWSSELIGRWLLVAVAYPVVYVAVEWVMHHGLKRPRA